MSRRISRRELLQWSTASLLAAKLWPGALAAKDKATGAFTFLVINDMHYVDADCGHFFEGVVRQMKATKDGLDFALLAGDISDNGKPEQLAAMRDIFDTLGVPFHVVPGNHDWLNATERPGYDDVFPKQYNYNFEHNGWQFVALDTTENVKFKDTIVQPQTMGWLADNLPKLDKGKPTVMFTHFPMAPHAPSRPVNAADVLAAFKEHNLQAVYGGHFHGFTQETCLGAPVVTNRCCSLKRFNHDGTKEKGYFLCRAKDGRLERSFVEVSAPPAPTTRPASQPTGKSIPPGRR